MHSRTTRPWGPLLAAVLAASTPVAAEPATSPAPGKTRTSSGVENAAAIQGGASAGVAVVKRLSSLLKSRKSKPAAAARAPVATPGGG